MIHRKQTFRTILTEITDKVCISEQNITEPVHYMTGNNSIPNRTFRNEHIDTIQAITFYFSQNTYFQHNILLMNIIVYTIDLTLFYIFLLEFFYISHVKGNSLERVAEKLVSYLLLN